MSILRIDPTRTTMLRRQFAGDLRARIDILKKQLLSHVLYNRGPWIVHNVEWGEKDLEQFQRWFDFSADRTVLTQGKDVVDSWLGDYVKQAYGRGLKRAHSDWRKPTQTILMSKEAGAAYQAGNVAEFMRQSFGGPTPVERLKALSLDTVNDLKGLTDQAKYQTSKVMLEGMASGLSPRDVAKQLSGVLDTYKDRSFSIAQTKMIKAFNEGALDGLENLGATSVGVMVEWSTSGLGFTESGYPSPCTKCAPLQGLVLTIEEARGLLPRHPRCRCSFIPANVGEKTEGQVRDADRIRAAIERSASGDSKWIGALKKISSVRP